MLPLVPRALLPLTLLLAAFAPPATTPDLPDPTTRADISEKVTAWNRHPKYETTEDGTLHALNLKSFEGIEEPLRRFIVADGKVSKQEPTQITDAGDRAVRMSLRYNATWWDGDQGTDRKDRQRAEIKGLGPHQKLDQTFEYSTTFRTDPDFVTVDRFCHVFQIKATDGDKGAPLITMSLSKGNHAAVRWFTGNKPAREFTFTPGQWTKVTIRVKTSAKPEGSLEASVNDDPFQGIHNEPISLKDATDYRPKWGLYRGTAPGLHDDWVEHKNVTARKLP